MDRDLERRLILKGIATASLAGLAPRAFAQAAPIAKLTSIRSTARSWLWSPEDYATKTGLFEKSALNVELAATNRHAASSVRRRADGPL